MMSLHQYSRLVFPRLIPLIAVCAVALPSLAQGPIYTVTVVSFPADSGWLTGAGSYLVGTPILLQAIPKDHYTFKNWTSNGVVIGPYVNCPLTVTGDQTVTANFTPDVPFPAPPGTPPSMIVAAPVISPPGGRYQKHVKVSITCATPGATIYYSVSGVSGPTVYRKPFGLGKSAGVGAYALKPGLYDSPISGQAYSIFPKLPFR